MNLPALQAGKSAMMAVKNCAVRLFAKGRARMVQWTTRALPLRNIVNERGKLN